MDKLKSFFYLTLSLLVTLSFFTACDDDKDGRGDIDEWDNDFILVVNQGVKSSNNSTLSIIDRNTEEVGEDIFFQANNQKLGDTANDILAYGTKVYVAVNVSATIEVLDSETLEVVGTIVDKNGAQPRQPRRLTAYEGKVYVSYYDGCVAKIDTTEFVIESIVEVGRSPEALVPFGGKLYVANSGGADFPNYDNTVSVINLSTFKVENTLEVENNPCDVCVDNAGNLFVASIAYYPEVGKLQKVSRSGEITNLLDDPYRMAIKDNRLYVICISYDNLWNAYVNYVQLDSESGEVVSDSFLKGDVLPPNPAGIAIDPYTEDIWIGSNNLGDYQGRGYAYRYDKNGNFMNKYYVGVNPIAFAFIR